MRTEVTHHDVRQATWVRDVTDEGIARTCGVMAFERGLGYVDAERVESMSTGDQGRLVLASVLGSRGRPYSTIVTALDSEVDGEPAWTGRCSCPVTYECKHVAAVVLTARELLLDPQQSNSPWQQELSSILRGRDRASSVVTPAVAPPAALAAGAIWDRHGALRDIELRPTRRTKSGTWHKSTTWSQVASSYQSGETYAPGHLGALRLLYRANSRSGDAYGAWSFCLSDVSPEGWELLARALEMGIELVPDSAHESPVQLDLRESVWCGTVLDQDSKGGVVVRATVAGLPEDASPVPFGRPTGAIAWVEQPRVVLVPCENEPDALTVDLLRHAPIEVPSDEVEEFTRGFLPRLEQSTDLRQRQELDDHDSAVLLHLRVKPVGLGEVEVEQQFAYGDDLASVVLGESYVGRRRLAERAVVDAVVEHLRPHGLVELVGGLSWWPLAQVTMRGMDAVRFSADLDELAALDHVTVEIIDELPAFDEITGDPQIEIGTRSPEDPSETDWFDLHVAVTIDGEEVPFEPLFQALSRGEAHLMLASGSYFRLDHPSLQRLKDLISEARDLQDQPGAGTKVNRFQVGLWEELVSIGVVGEQANEWASSVDRLRTIANLTPPDVPADLRAQLRPYQHDGYAWLATLWDADLGGVLADDMGLGKTLQVLAMLERARAAGEFDQPVLVVAPTSMVGTWVSEARKFAPGLRSVAVTETAAKRGEPLSSQTGGAHVVVTTYTLLRIDAEEFQSVTWRGVVLDEAQAIKNHQSKTYQAVRRLRAPFRLAMSGTPLENSLMDLWSLLSVTAPGLYPKPEDFTVRYRKPIESGKAPQLLDQLRRRIRPLMMRRTKDQVAKDLPDKQIQISNVPLTPVHARIYDQHLQRERQRILGLLDDPDTNQIAILAALTRLRQLALDPALVDEEYAGLTTSAKLTTLVEHVQEIAAEGHRALVFSQFTRYLGLARDALTKAGLETCYLDGSMSAKTRGAQVEAFREGDAPAFLISLKAGGSGLTLTEADYVFILDPWWNPATEAQAIDRTHRIGQDKPVMVYRLVSEGTIEDKVVALQQRKRDLFDRVMNSGGALSGAITADDVKGLLDL